jgi:hypothetical protein
VADGGVVGAAEVAVSDWVEVGSDLTVVLLCCPQPTAKNANAATVPTRVPIFTSTS